MLTMDEEFRAAAKLNAHEKVLKKGPTRLSFAEMVNVGVDVGVDFERLRVCSVLRQRAAQDFNPIVKQVLAGIAAEVEEGIR